MHDISQQNGVAVEIRDLVYQYHESDRAALNGLSLTVRVGERVGIAGPNGAGKSTLLTHLNGVKQGRGEIRILGLSLAGLGRRARQVDTVAHGHQGRNVGVAGQQRHQGVVGLGERVGCREVVGHDSALVREPLYPLYGPN